MNFYKHYQKELLFFINSRFGREYLNITNSYEVVKVAPNAIHFHVGKNIYQAEFRTDNFIDRKLRIYIEIALSYTPELIYDPFNLINSIHLTTMTFNAAAGGSGSGRLNSQNASFATARAGSSISVITSIGQLANTLTGGTYTLDHDYTPFVTSSLPSKAKILSAFINYKGSAGTTDTDSFALVIVKSTQASFTTLVSGDWANIGSTSFGSVTAVSWTASGNNQVVLNASGIANISFSGTSGFAAIGNRDFNNAAPTGTNILGLTGISDIFLSVTYTLAGGAFLLNFL